MRAMVGAPLGNRLSAQTPFHRYEQGVEDWNRQHHGGSKDKTRNDGNVVHIHKRSRPQQKPDKKAAGIPHENLGRFEIKHQESCNRPRRHSADYRVIAISPDYIETGEISGGDQSYS